MYRIVARSYIHALGTCSSSLPCTLLSFLFSEFLLLVLLLLLLLLELKLELELSCIVLGWSLIVLLVTREVPFALAGYGEVVVNAAVPSKARSGKRTDANVSNGSCVRWVCKDRCGS